MVCIDDFSKYAAAVPIHGNTENDLALGMIESIAKMGKPPQIIYTDGERSIRNNGLFQKYVNENKITVHYTKGHIAFAERFLGTLF